MKHTGSWLHRAPCCGAEMESPWVRHLRSRAIDRTWALWMASCSSSSKERGAGGGLAGLAVICRGSSGSGPMGSHDVGQKTWRGTSGVIWGPQISSCSLLSHLVRSPPPLRGSPGPALSPLPSADPTSTVPTPLLQCPLSTLCLPLLAHSPPPGLHHPIAFAHATPTWSCPLTQALPLPCAPPTLQMPHPLGSVCTLLKQLTTKASPVGTIPVSVSVPASPGRGQGWGGDPGRAGGQVPRRRWCRSSSWRRSSACCCSRRSSRRRDSMSRCFSCSARSAGGTTAPPCGPRTWNGRKRSSSAGFVPDTGSPRWRSCWRSSDTCGYQGEGEQWALVPLWGHCASHWGSGMLSACCNVQGSQLGWESWPNLRRLC